MVAGGKFQIGLIHHDEIVRLAQRRVDRAAARRKSVDREEDEAQQALTAALSDRADWITSNPDDQMEMF